MTKRKLFQAGIPFIEQKKILVKGVIPSNKLTDCVVYKTVKKGQKSFRITTALLSKLVKKAKEIGKTPLLTITIPTNEKENYVLTCCVTKEKI